MADSSCLLKARIPRACLYKSSLSISLSANQLAYATPWHMLASPLHADMCMRRSCDWTTRLYKLSVHVLQWCEDAYEPGLLCQAWWHQTQMKGDAGAGVALSVNPRAVLLDTLYLLSSAALQRLCNASVQYICAPTTNYRQAYTNRASFAGRPSCEVCQVTCLPSRSSSPASSDRLKFLGKSCGAWL